jgi:hypothetical protein
MATKKDRQLTFSPPFVVGSWIRNTGEMRKIRFDGLMIWVKSLKLTNVQIHRSKEWQTAWYWIGTWV